MTGENLNVFPVLRFDQSQHLPQRMFYGPDISRELDVLRGRQNFRFSTRSRGRVASGRTRARFYIRARRLVNFSILIRSVIPME
jgi:hypothetical protein